MVAGTDAKQRLIDANAYLKKVCTYKESGCGSCKLQTACPADEPTIEAEPVRHGKWIIRDNPKTEWYMITCSVCGEDVTSTAPCIGFFPNAKVLWDYCPNCGCKMADQ